MEKGHEEHEEHEEQHQKHRSALRALKKPKDSLLKSCCHSIKPTMKFWSRSMILWSLQALEKDAQVLGEMEAFLGPLSPFCQAKFI